MVTTHKSVHVGEGSKDIHTNGGDFAIEVQPFAKVQEIGKIRFGKVPRLLSVSIEVRGHVSEGDLRVVLGMGLWRARCHQRMTTRFALRLIGTLNEKLHMVHTWSFESMARKKCVVSYCGGGDMYAFEGLAYVKTKSMPA
jgi:hypothetical protein